MHKLRVGVLLHSEEVSKYDHDLITWMSSEPSIELVLAIIRREPNSALNGGSAHRRYLDEVYRFGVIRFLARAILRKVVVPIEKRLLSRLPLFRNHSEKKPASHLFPEKLYVSPITSPSGFVDRFSSGDIEKIKSYQLDLMLRCGFGILRGEILDAARLGILSFHHADNRINRGGPPGFWEVLLGQDTTGFVIQRITEELDGGVVLVRGNVRTLPYFLLNEASVVQRSFVHMKNLIRRIARDGHLPIGEQRTPYSFPLYKNPGLRHVLRYLGYLLGYLLRRIFDKLSRRQSAEWSILVATGAWREAVFWRSSSFENPKGRFLADPFVVSLNGETVIFVEDFRYAINRAAISAFRVQDSDVTELGCCIDETFHLSFPFVFDYQGSLYMCPESHQVREIRLYKCEEFPLKWSLASTLMSDVSAADTMLFERNGKWWMLTNLDYTGQNDHNNELYLFYSDSPLSRNWSAHPQNLSLPRFRGHLLKGGYDGQDGKERATGTTAVQ